MSLSLSIQWNFAKIPLIKIEQNNKNPIFQNKNAFFLYLGVLWQEVHFTKCLWFYERIFSLHLTHLVTTPPTGFLLLWQYFWENLANQLFFSIFWVFMHHPLKFGSFSLKIDQEINFQSWPFQTLFWQLTHSAMKISLFSFRRYEETFENAQGRKINKMQPMWKCLFSFRRSEETFENT